MKLSNLDGNGVKVGREGELQHKQCCGMKFGKPEIPGGGGEKKKKLLDYVHHSYHFVGTLHINIIS